MGHRLGLPQGHRSVSPFPSAGTYCGKCPLCHSNADAKGQRLRSCGADLKTGGGIVLDPSVK